MTEIIKREPAARVDYVEIVHPEELTPAPKADPGTVAALAVFINETRLIDNTVFGEDDLRIGAA
jgi:pantoate--beta-alanine ligase